MSTYRFLVYQRINVGTNLLHCSSLMASTHLTTKDSTRSSPNPKTEYDEWRSKEFFGEGLPANDGGWVRVFPKTCLSTKREAKFWKPQIVGEDSTALWVDWDRSAVLKRNR